MSAFVQCQDCGWPEGDEDAYLYGPNFKADQSCPKCGGLMCNQRDLAKRDRQRLAAWLAAAKGEKR